MVRCGLQHLPRVVDQRGHVIAVNAVWRREPGQCGDGGEHIDEVGQRRSHRGRLPGDADQQRDPDGEVEVALLFPLPMLAEVVSVIGVENDDGVRVVSSIRVTRLGEYSPLLVSGPNTSTRVLGLLEPTLGGGVAEPARVPRDDFFGGPISCPPTLPNVPKYIQ